MKKYLLFLLLPLTTFAAPTIQVNGTRISTEDKAGNLHDAGDIRDFVKNYSDLASSARAAMKTAVEAKVADLSKVDLVRLKAEMTVLKAAGGSVDPVKEGILDTQITVVADKVASDDVKRGK